MTSPFANRAGDAVFLCYHSIADRGSRYLALPPAAFEWQLAYLRDRGFRSGGLADLQLLRRGEPLPGPTVFLTFDDGYVDNARVAMPLMKEHGFRPIIFVLPQHLEEGAPLNWAEVAEDYAANPEEMTSMTWADAEAIVAEGAEIGSHTLSHSHLIDLAPDCLASELAESKALVEARLGTCPVVAYPFGEWNPAVRDAAAEAGYEFAFSLPSGPQHAGECGDLVIPRVNVDYRDTGRRFALKLSGAGRRLLFSQAGEVVRRTRSSLPVGR